MVAKSPKAPYRHAERKPNAEPPRDDSFVILLGSDALRKLVVSSWASVLGRT